MSGPRLENPGGALQLTPPDRAMLSGEEGPAVAMAMRLVAGLARAAGARRLLDVTGAHVDSALCQGRASLDFAARLRDLGGRVRVPTTLNIGSVDLLHPGLTKGDEAARRMGRETMRAYADMGGVPTWTCAPYQMVNRPARGEYVAWGESNAVAFANSVLGARTPRFGDFADIAAAVTGRAPEMGLYLDRNRRADVRYHLSGFSGESLAGEELFAVLGFLIGSDAGAGVPVITGMERATEDQLKVLGAAAATSGAVGMFHVAGVTPEAPDLAAVAGPSLRREEVTPPRLSAARRALSTADGGEPQVINLGTPHYSVGQVERLRRLLDGREIHPRVTLYVNLGRDTLAAVDGVRELEEQGVVFVTDTCTYVTSILDEGVRLAMCDSAKWAYYAPGNLGIEVVFGSTEECAESAVAGRVIRDGDRWT